MRAALAVAVVLAVCGLLAVVSRGEVGGGDGLGVCSGEGVCGGGFGPAVHPTSGEGREASGGAEAVQSCAEMVCGCGVGVWVPAAAVESRCARSSFGGRRLAAAAIESGAPSDAGNVASLVSRTATACAGGAAAAAAIRSEACDVVREAA